MLLMPSHRPREEKYRSPVGAVEIGCEIELKIAVPCCYEVCEAYLCVKTEDSEGISDEKHEMKRAYTDEAAQEDVFSVKLTAPDRGSLLWYYFSLRRMGGEVYYYGRMEPTDENPDITGGIYNEIPPMWQITVYAPLTCRPQWYSDTVTYHIFVDRFNRSRKPYKTGWRSRRDIRDDWYSEPSVDFDENGKQINVDFFGGNLKGIIEKLDYLKSLSVGTIYLSPIFEASSNHRYDTGDYMVIDKMIGTSKQFAELCTRAHKLGMRVMLDGVFSHTGSDSRYFNSKGHYDSIGAAQDKSSPYYEWYDFKHWPDDYDCWWDVLTLPCVKEENEDYMRFIITGEDSVIKHWMRLGADGWRLDVADELPDGFLERLYAEVKSEKPDAAVIGEVWEDASNKSSYDKRRFYLCGGKLDGVMNYPLREAVIDFLEGGDAHCFVNKMSEIEQNYPFEALLTCMNVIGTHDTERILTRLGDDVELVKLASVLQYCYPGSPSLYYGDEAGLAGEGDPYNRRGYPWGRENTELIDHYKALGKLRSSSEALRRGRIKYIRAEGGLLVFERYTDSERVVVTIDRSEKRWSIEKLQ